MNRNRLFIASCIALVTTSMFFSIRSDAADALANDFRLTNEQLGFIFQPAFYGFTLSILIGGSLVDLFGMRRLLTVSGLFYVFAILAIVVLPFPDAQVASIFGEPITLTLWVAMLALGLAQGLVEGVINPLCSTLYPEDKTHRMNVLHAWWPGGLIVGGLLAYFITLVMGLGGSVSAETATLGWRVKLLTIPVAALTYLVLIRGQRFPKTERVAAGVSNRDMLSELLRPSFIFLWICMWLTSASELGPDQWVPSLITNLTGGMPGILILVYTAGIMFVLRFFGGPLAHRFSPFGLMAIGAALTAVGLYSLGSVSTMAGAFAAATIFGVGKTYFWPSRSPLWAAPGFSRPEPSFRSWGGGTTGSGRPRRSSTSPRSRSRSLCSSGCSSCTSASRAATSPSRSAATARLKYVKRHAALVPLSRQHHDALALGVFIERDLKTEDPSALERLREQALDLWELELRGHFEVEESVLFPAVRRQIPDPGVVDQLVREHEEIAAALADLKEARADSLAQRLRSLREALVSHVRTEERVLFEAVQSSVSEGDLAAIGKGIEETLPAVCARLGSAQV